MSVASSASALAGLSPDAKLMITRGAQAEEIASEIMWRKRMLVDLDRQRQECMQALATLRDKKSPSAAASASAGSAAGASTAAIAVAASSLPPSQLHAPPPSKLWVSLSSNFVRLPREHVADMLRRDRDKLDAEIDAVRKEMKDKMKQMQAIAPSLQLEKGLLDFALA